MGGSFDPVHVAHVALAEVALRHLALDEVRWVPVGQAWQKARQLAPAKHRLAMVQAHFWTGLAILALMLPRLLLAFSRPAPAVKPPLPAWQALPAKAMHLLLYAMLIVQPLLGLGTAWTDGKEILLPFTQFALPALLAPDAALAGQLEDLHELLGTAFYYVVGLHAAAALYHHFVRRDDTLRRMA